MVTLSIGLLIDAFEPIAEMSDMDPHVRNRTNCLDGAIRRLDRQGQHDAARTRGHRGARGGEALAQGVPAVCGHFGGGDREDAAARFRGVHRVFDGGEHEGDVYHGMYTTSLHIVL